MHITYEIIGTLLQALGVVMVLGSQAFFVRRARKKHGSLGTAFLEIQAMRVYMNPEKVKETVRNKQKLKEAFEKFPHAKLLYDDFKYTVIGLVITLVGLIIEMFEGSIVIQFRL
jgi:hypothetical protein